MTFAVTMVTNNLTRLNNNFIIYRTFGKEEIIIQEVREALFRTLCLIFLISCPLPDFEPGERVHRVCFFLMEHFEILCSNLTTSRSTVLESKHWKNAKYVIFYLKFINENDFVRMGIFSNECILNQDTKNN